MPIPSLPLEIVDLVLSHLGDDLEELDRRKNGIKLALVCKAWRPSADEMRLHDLELVPVIDDAYVRHLLTRPEMLRHCRRLKVTEYKVGDVVDSDADEQAQEAARRPIGVREAPLYIDLLGLVSRVESLALPGTAPEVNLLAGAATSPMASTLLRLHASVRSFPFIDLNKLAETLSSFRRLEYLSLVVGFLGRAPVEYHDSVPTSRLRLSHFSLTVYAHFGVGMHACLPRLFSDLLDPTSLTPCKLPYWTGEPFFINCLPQYVNLATLSVEAVDAQSIAPNLDTLCQILPHLLALENLALTARNVGLPNHISPISSSDFLFALPQSIKRALLTGVFFEPDPAIRPYLFVNGRLPGGNVPTPCLRGRRAKRRWGVGGR
ncbi:hypothetical protein JCM11641_008146 [Rhodosporidiobolus odoratus]